MAILARSHQLSGNYTWPELKSRSGDTSGGDKEPHQGDIIAARDFNPWNKMPDFDFGFWPSARQSIKNVSPKTGKVDGRFVSK
jgi:hypothetical protein